MNTHAVLWLYEMNMKIKNLRIDYDYLLALTLCANKKGIQLLQNVFDTAFKIDDILVHMYLDFEDHEWYLPKTLFRSRYPCIKENKYPKLY